MSELSHSMHEFYETRDVTAYAVAMNKVVKSSSPLPSPAVNDDDDDDDTDGSTSSSDGCGSCEVAASTTTTVPSASEPTNEVMMRSSLSMVNLPSETMRQMESLTLDDEPSSTAAPSGGSDPITAIEEEEGDVEQKLRDAVVATLSSTAAAVDDSKDCDVDTATSSTTTTRQPPSSPTLTKQHPNSNNNNINNNRSTTNNLDLTNSTNRRPSRRSLQQQQPLKSSLKSSKTSLTSSLTSTTHSSLKHSVSFTQLEIRSYPLTLGDTPNLSGPPLSLDWNYDPSATQVHNIDNYENLRQVSETNPTPSQPRCSTMEELFIHPSHRQYLLLRHSGYTRKQIQKATEEAQRLAKERRRNARRPVCLDEMVERASRRLGGWRKKSKSKR